MTDYPALLSFARTDRQREVLGAIIKAGSHNKAAVELNVSRQTVDGLVKAVKVAAEQRLYSPEHGLTKGVPEGFTGDFTATFNNQTGEYERVWYKGKADQQQKRALFEGFVTGLAEDIKPAKPSKFKLDSVSSDLATAIILGDPHIGMLAHAIETLGEDYDVAKASADIRAAVDFCVDCAPASEEGWFINLGDALHACGTKNTTHKGTQVDVAARHNQVMRAAATVFRYAVDKMLTKFKTVKVINARGNHDEDAAFALNFYMEALYEREPRVEVFGNDAKFNFIEFGQNLIMINHGDGINDNRAAGVMTKLAAEAWGRTQFRRGWHGHIHHKTRREHDSGVIFESFPVLGALDAWHAASGFGSERGCTAITLHKEFGEANRMEPTIAMIRAFTNQ